jgi:hypothetical protein
MDWYVISLRVLHIGGGVFWAGAGLFNIWFVQSAAAASGPTGGAFMGRLMNEKKGGMTLGIAGVVTILSGGFLYWHDFGSFAPSNAPMVGFAIGAVAAIVVWIVAVAVMLPAGAALQGLGERAAKGEDVTAERNATVRRQAIGNQTSAWLMILAVLMMAIARYL